MYDFTFRGLQLGSVQFPKENFSYGELKLLNSGPFLVESNKFLIWGLQGPFFGGCGGEGVGVGVGFAMEKHPLRPKKPCSTGATDRFFPIC